MAKRLARQEVMHRFVYGVRPGCSWYLLGWRIVTRSIDVV